MIKTHELPTHVTTYAKHATAASAASAASVTRVIYNVAPKRPKSAMRRALLGATDRVDTAVHRFRLKLIDEHEEAKRSAERMREDKTFQDEVNQFAADAKNDKLPPPESLEERLERNGR
jgi:hypothetical protein